MKISCQKCPIPPFFPVLSVLSFKPYTGPKGNCRVLATAWADGLDFSELPQHLRHRAVRLAAEACLVQLLITGFVHADPHEGCEKWDGMGCLSMFVMMFFIMMMMMMMKIGYIPNEIAI